MQKHGSAAEGTAAAHIMSHEVMKQCIGDRYYSEEKQLQMIREMNSSKNLRIKTKQGNLYGTDGYSGDRYYDRQINQALRGSTPSERTLTNQRAVERAQRQWESFKGFDVDNGYKAQVRQNFSQLRDKDGHRIVRSNASFNK